VHDLEQVAHRLISGADHDPGELDYADLMDDVLPDWRDDWLLVERERFRQLRMHALEALSVRLAHAGRLAQAIDASLAVVCHEPLRESAQRALIGAHILEGNLQEAVRQYRTFRDLLSSELGIGPSPLMVELVRSLNVQ
jgi:DNA-binding SARP family transcriptional activator